MRERLIRLAKFNQKWFGALLLTFAYLLGLGPAAVYYRLSKLFGLTRKQERGWVPLKNPSPSLKQLEEQS